MLGSRCSVALRDGEFPAIRQPRGEVAVGCDGQVNQQLCEVELRIDVVSAAGGGEAGEDSCRAATTRVAHEEAVFPIMEILA